MTTKRVHNGADRTPRLEDLPRLTDEMRDQMDRERDPEAELAAAEHDELSRATVDRIWKEHEARKSEPPSVNTHELFVLLDRANNTLDHIDDLIEVVGSALRHQDCNLDSAAARVLSNDTYTAIESLRGYLQCAVELIPESLRAHGGISHG